MSKILAFTLADAVEAVPGQKFHVLGGGIDRFSASEFPTTIFRLALLLALEVEAGNDVEFLITIKGRHANGQEFMSIELKGARNGPNPDNTVIWQGINLPPMTFNGPEKLTFVASAGESRRTISLTITGPLTVTMPASETTRNN